MEKFVAYSFKNIRRDKEKGGSSWSGNDKEHFFLIKFDRIGMLFMIFGFVLQFISNFLPII